MNTLSKVVPALCLTAALTAGGTAHAATVTLTGWAHGTAVTVDTAGGGSGLAFNGHAGAFKGRLLGAGGFDIDAFVTYCIELTESFNFSTTPMTGYQVVQGNDYFERRRGDAGIADRLGRLMTWVSGDSERVGSASKSAALQLAIWNTIYDTDAKLTARSGDFSDKSSAAGYATALLAGAASVQHSRFEVFALEKQGKQDFLLLRQNAVPEPSSLALVAMALAGLGLARRRRRPA